MTRILTILFLVVFSNTQLIAEENFLLIDGVSSEFICEFGAQTDERISPCSTFKIPLALMGFDSHVLLEKDFPTMYFQEGYPDFLETWKLPQTPQSWIKCSCLWFSQVIVEKMGMDRVHYYLSAFDYGNQDMSGGPKRAWISSSLKISPREQVAFLRKLVLGLLPVSGESLSKTKQILFVDEIGDGWKLYGKTGWGTPVDDKQIGWFVGWVEKNEAFFPFAYVIRDYSIDLGRRIPRTKELVLEHLD